jgi:hypothetical protein
MTIDAKKECSESIEHCGPETVEAIALDQTVIDHDKLLRLIMEGLIRHVADDEMDDEMDVDNDDELNARINVGIEATSILLTEYKTAAGVRTNQIESIQFEKESGIYTCRIDDNDISIFQRIEESIVSNSIENLRISEIEVDRFLDMVSRVCLSRVTQGRFDTIDDYRNNIKNVFRRGINMRTKNIRGCLTISQSMHASDYLLQIKEAVVDLYLVFDIFCSLTIPHESIEEFRYFLHRDSDFRNHTLICNLNELNRASDIIYYHSLDSKMVIETDDLNPNARVEKKCRCRHESFMHPSSLASRIGRGELDPETVFNLITGEMQREKTVNIGQIDLIKNRLSQKPEIETAYSDHLKSLVSNKVIDACEDTKSIKIPIKVYDTNVDSHRMKNRSPKNNRQHKRSDHHRNYPGHNYNVRRQKANLTRSADTDRHWRSR